MSNQEAWNKFMQTGRVDYYLLSRGINIYASGVFPQEKKSAVITAQSAGGDIVESDGFGNCAESTAVGRQ
ncbi:MAG: hypothetical protein ACI4IJ_02450 [Acutalibacteraceae bacterium]